MRNLLFCFCFVLIGCTTATSVEETAVADAASDPTPISQLAPTATAQPAPTAESTLAPTPEPVVEPTALPDPAELSDALIEAIFAGDSEEIAALLTAGADVESKAISGASALYIAVGKVDAGIVEQLLAAGASVNPEHNLPTTPLLAAALQGDLEIVTQLVEAGADIEVASKDHFAHTALTSAIREGHTETAVYLIEQGSDINDVSQNNHLATPLMVATRYGCTDCVVLLLGEGVYIDQFDLDGVTALKWAVQYKHLAALELLLAAGADPLLTDVNGNTVIQIAEKKGADNFVTLLSDAVAATEARAIEISALPATERDALLNAAVQNGDIRELRACVQAGVSAAQNPELLLTAVQADNVDAVVLLARAGADLNALLPDQHTPLSLAASSGQLEMVRALVEQGADMDLVDGNGEMAVETAVTHDYPEIEALLLELAAAETSGE